MIIVRVKGGLGNQLFQYALGRVLAIKNSDVLKLDIDFYRDKGREYERKFLLNQFNIPELIATDQEIIRVKKSLGVYWGFKSWLSKYVLKEHNILFDAGVLKLNGDLYLDGFWQSPRYFESYKKILKSDLRPRHPLTNIRALEVQGLIKCNISVGIHVRRGDYVLNNKCKNKLGPCSITYYKNAIQLISKDLIDPLYIVFSDDISWAKENLKFPSDKVEFIGSNHFSDIDSFFLMSSCNHNIISNSSFSWWAAWIGEEKNKIVIAPQPWFNKIKYDKKLTPDHWILINK